MKIKKDDKVLIVSGKDKGKQGKVSNSFPMDKKIIVEGFNLKKKHQKPKKQGEKGQIVLIPGRIPVSNVKLICPKCSKPTRVGYKVNEKNKVRICKKCNEEI
ncbi:MAG: 50S ribosomal protein L24 [Candidatus Nealsonbacteria bacterium]